MVAIDRFDCSLKQTSRSDIQTAPTHTKPISQNRNDIQAAPTHTKPISQKRFFYFAEFLD